MSMSEVTRAPISGLPGLPPISPGSALALPPSTTPMFAYSCTLPIQHTQGKTDNPSADFADIRPEPCYCLTGPTIRSPATKDGLQCYSKCSIAQLRCPTD